MIKKIDKSEFVRSILERILEEGGCFEFTVEVFVDALVAIECIDDSFFTKKKVS